VNFGSWGVTAAELLLGCVAANCQYLAGADDPGGSWWRGSVGIRNWVPWLDGAVGIWGGGVF